MKRVLILLTFTILLTSLASAEILINQQPKDLYNLGDIIKIPIKIATSEGIQNFFSMNLLCNGIDTEVHKQYISLEAGEEQSITIAIPLIKSFIGKSTGTCKLKATIGENSQLTSEFRISNSIQVNLDNTQNEVAPGEELIIEGEAIKENGEYVDGGFVDLLISSEDLTEEIKITETINNGYFYLNASFPEGTKSSQYLVKITAYENIEGNTSNTGFVDYNVLVTQVPTSLEISLENEEVEPGTPLRVKAILHDQTGEKIVSTAIITIKDDEGIVLEQTEIATDSFLEHEIVYNQAPSEWEVYAVSNKLNTESKFKIIEKESVKVDIVNKTVIITNNGNVPYNDTVIVKIGNSSVNLKAYLALDESRRYALTAPDGEYQVSVLHNGENKATGTFLLTGGAIDVREATGGVFRGAPLVWIFMIAILGFVAMIVFKKGYNRAFVGYITKMKEGKKAQQIEKQTLVNPTRMADLSLSLKGDSQNVSIIGLKLKNFKEVLANEAAKNLLQETAELAEAEKATIYENNENLFYILAPATTKTFNNEKTAIQLADGITKVIARYNKLAKNKIAYGLSINTGSIVAKAEGKGIKFMSLGSLMGLSKKIAGISQGEILLSESLMDKIRSDVKAEKKEVNGVSFYAIQEIKKQSKKNEKFIHNFIRKLEKENSEKLDKK